MKNKYNILSIIIIVILLANSIVIYCLDDREGPVIKIPKKGLLYTEGENLTELLAGVTATDVKDGDVSDTLMVESLIPLSNGTTAKVTYAARDKESHITKKSFIVQYIALNTNKDEAQKNQDITPTQVPKGNDKIDNEKPSNSITPTMKPKKVKENPVIKLNTKEVTLVKDSLFDPMKYVKDVTDNKDNRDDIYTRIHVDGYYNLKIPGTYIVEYYALDSDGNKSAPAYLKLIITQ